jgi:uncharacterized protein (DUF427 family)
MINGVNSEEKTVQAIWRGRVIADSQEIREAAGYRYFPRAHVRMDLLTMHPRTADDLECPHGVQFYDVVDGSEVSRRAAWSYEAPRPSLQAVDHWIAFWEDVQLVD